MKLPHKYKKKPKHNYNDFGFIKLHLIIVVIAEVEI